MTAKAQKIKPPRKRRRSPVEIRGLLLDAARDHFRERGYANSTTRDIADRAGLSEAMLFRQFGTKAALFEQAILEPFNEFVSNFVEEWTKQNVAGSGEVGLEQLSRSYVSQFYQLLREQGASMMAMLTAYLYEQGAPLGSGETMESPLGVILQQVQDQIDSRRAEFGIDEEFDVRFATRAVYALVFGVSVLEDWLFPEGPGDTEHMVDKLTEFIEFGWRGKPKS
ncbi:TetR/AcrR family transcriptional regulator [Parasphingorhabdus sp.]|uniref:TetR/AcrR family transcriptional regulator n=1 Tax=Parasphingorhabdus sp. TaxID=2709688 RepID=UPI003A911ADF